MNRQETKIMIFMMVILLIMSVSFIISYNEAKELTEKIDKMGCAALCRVSAWIPTFKYNETNNQTNNKTWFTVNYSQ